MKGAVKSMVAVFPAQVGGFFCAIKINFNFSSADKALKLTSNFQFPVFPMLCML